MNSFITKLAGLFVIYTIVITTVYCTNFRGLDLSQDELIALTRDHFGRTDPDELLNGFFPVWAGIQFLIACFFFIIAVISTICYFLGCRTPAEPPKKRIT